MDFWTHNAAEGGTLYSSPVQIAASIHLRIASDFHMILETQSRQSTPRCHSERSELVGTDPHRIVPSNVILNIARRLGELRNVSYLGRVNKHYQLRIGPFLKFVKPMWCFDARSSRHQITRLVLKYEKEFAGKARLAEPSVKETEGSREKPRISSGIVPMDQSKALEPFKRALRLSSRLPEGLDPSGCIAGLLDALAQLPDRYFNECCGDAFAAMSSPRMMKAWTDEILRRDQSMQQRCMAAVLNACTSNGSSETLSLEKTLDHMRHITKMPLDLASDEYAALLQPLIAELVDLPAPALVFMTLVLLKRVRGRMPHPAASKSAVSEALEPLASRLMNTSAPKLVGQAIGELATFSIACLKPSAQPGPIIDLVRFLIRSQHDDSWLVLRDSMAYCVAQLQPAGLQDLMSELLRNGISRMGDSELVALYECAAICEKISSVDPLDSKTREQLQLRMHHAATPPLMQAMTHWMCESASRNLLEREDSLVPDLCTTVLKCESVHHVALLDQVAAIVDVMTTHGKLGDEEAHEQLMHAAESLTPADYGFFTLCQLSRIHTRGRIASPEAERILTGLKHWIVKIRHKPSAFAVLLKVVLHTGVPEKVVASFCVGALHAMREVGYKNSQHREVTERVVNNLLKKKSRSIRNHFTRLFSDSPALLSGLGTETIRRVIKISRSKVSARTIDEFTRALMVAPDLWLIPRDRTLAAMNALASAAFALKANKKAVITARNALNLINLAGALSPKGVRKYIDMHRTTDASLTTEVLASLRDWSKSAPHEEAIDFESEFYSAICDNHLKADAPRPQEVDALLKEFRLKISGADRTDKAAIAVFSHLFSSKADDGVGPASKSERKRKLAVLELVMAFVMEQVERDRMSIKSFNVLVQRAKTIWRACNDSLLGRMPYHSR